MRARRFRRPAPIRPVAFAAPVEEFTGVDEPVVGVDELLLHRIHQLRAEIEALQAAAGSTPAPVAGAPADPTMFDRLPAPLAPMAKAFLTEGSPQRRVARFGIDSLRATRAYVHQVQHEWSRTGLREVHTPGYTTWRRRHAAGRGTSSAQRVLSAKAVDPIQVDVVIVATGNERGANRLAKTLDSLRTQTWSHWRSTVVETRDALAGALDREPGRDFVVFLEAGDVLRPDCLFEVAAAARRDPFIDLVYWDDDVADPVRGARDPQFRPDWSPEYLLGTNYLGRSFAIRHRRMAACGGIGAGPGDARYWDLLLRAGFEPGQVERLPRVLSRVGRRPTPNADESVATVQAELDRRGDGARAVVDRDAVRVIPPAAGTPSVSIVIPTRHNRELVGRCLASIRAHRRARSRRHHRRQRRADRGERAVVRRDRSATSI